MPLVRFRDRVIACHEGERLRDVLLRAGESPHNQGATLVNCRGFGTCGTCAVEVHGPLPPKTARERWRLSFPPHSPESNLRLACQIKVQGDLEVVKHDGFWGQHVRAQTDGPERAASGS